MILTYMSRSVITEAQVRRIIQEELFLKQLNEGLWDDVKAGALKLRALVTQKFGQAASKWGNTIQNTLSKLELPEEVKLAIKVLKTGMQESGESIQLDDQLKVAKQFGQLNKEQALAVAQQDLEGPVHSLAQQAQQQGTQAEARYYGQVYEALLERPSVPQSLNEFGVGSAIGVSLALLGGLPMLFKGLAKLAGVLHAEKTAELFHRAEHVTHSFEVKAINAVVPNKLSYAAYKGLHKSGLRFSKESDDVLSFDEYVKSSYIKQVNGLLYKALLIYFAFQGLVGVLHAGASLVGFVEGAATTVKGVELARGAAEIAALAGKAA